MVACNSSHQALVWGRRALVETEYNSPAVFPFAIGGTSYLMVSHSDLVVQVRCRVLLAKSVPSNFPLVEPDDDAWTRGGLSRLGHRFFCKLWRLSAWAKTAALFYEEVEFVMETSAGANWQFKRTRAHPKNWYCLCIALSLAFFIGAVGSGPTIFHCFFVYCVQHRFVVKCLRPQESLLN